jgi:uncharacterized protein (TIGR02001 family)
MKMKATVLLSTLALSGGVFAQAAAPAAPEPDYTLSFNVGAVTDYRYRGISQTRKKPALQGGADFSHKSGFYLGTWLSTIKWIKDGGGDAPIEWDIYGGYKGTAGPIGYDVGLLRYQYPSHDLAISPNTTELYIAGTYGPATLKYSHATTNLFGFADSKRSGYLDLSATFDLGNGWSITPHIGHQKVRNNSPFSYTDYSLTVGKDLGNGLSASAALIGTDNDNYIGPNGKNLGNGTVVLGVKYAF